MSSAQVVVLILAVLIAMLVGGVVLLVSRRQTPRGDSLEALGSSDAASPEQRTGSRHAAEPAGEPDLVVREPVVRTPAPVPELFELRPLAADTRQHYLEAWDGVESLFLDRPVLALSAADALLTQLMAERGLPQDASGTAHRLSDEHVQVLRAFQAGHAIEQQNTTENADDEQVREGMLHFRRVFEVLVREDEPHPAPASAGQRESR